MQHTLYKIAVMFFTATLCAIFKEPNYLVLLIMLFMFRPPKSKQDVLEELHSIQDRIDILYKDKLKERTEQQKEL